MYIKDLLVPKGSNIYSNGSCSIILDGHQNKKKQMNCLQDRQTMSPQQLCTLHYRCIPNKGVNFFLHQAETPTFCGFLFPIFSNIH